MSSTAHFDMSQRQFTRNLVWYLRGFVAGDRNTEHIVPLTHSRFPAFTPMHCPSKSRYSLGVEDIWSLLANPVRLDPARPPRKREPWRRQPTRRRRVAPLDSLERLPPEVILMVMEYMDDEAAGHWLVDVWAYVEDVIALSLCSTRLWDIGLRHIMVSYFNRLHAPWADTPISCWARISRFSRMMSCAGGPVTKECECNRFYSAHIENHSVKPFIITSFERKWKDALGFHGTHSGIPRNTLDSLARELKAPDLFPKDIPWVLRNLTTKEYVRDRQKMAPLKGDWVGVEKPKTMNLGVALMCRTWYIDNLDLPRDSKDLSGKWEGHRFEIAKWDDHVKKVGSEDKEWKDVTMEVLDDAEEFWNILFP
ncbi:hypothetical protein M501DRAFT_1033343 [Patellaria atrata CBS 101060]|uniref:Uncharacterized protein n=1 Tax=Patellaria atrata CBS 101060 TaxID=1346257 RepID=A0A9P4S7N5_9PEZI|nr:hypothetical protein M501DRAFT_1033343 [Patellaria atrata CBS 101060]